ncbi:amp-dependent synthetase/ligase [Lucifera butyrica]|uniref:Amp-dependent synthetase/ligase n=1 Tax=Lucifera butyrica TaxID=1351585 RepID=A0A498R9Y2_9FIRM|nr:AMP-binding protein [Lucifera butyrica]VBB07795.1 amp-dependent synthetase/ligase [Lucifera butyrica]
MKAAMLNKTPLEAWIANRLGLSGTALTRQQIERYQLQKLQETICLAVGRSPFYRELLKDFTATELLSLADLEQLPFTTAEDIRQHGLQFLCVSQNEISRVVTLDSSGTTGRTKRLFFTAAEQELTIDFFRQGMATLVEAGDRVLILLPVERSGCVGDLLAIALRRLGVRPVPHGIVTDIRATLRTMERERIHSLVGIPAQVLALARHAAVTGRRPLRLKSVLLSTDHVPDAIVRELRRSWNCQVFEHYGMTEMGLGGGVDCGLHTGYHLREADLYFEIIDPVTGKVLPDGQEGEVVFTTLTRQGMPLIRYRTGDISRFLPGLCGCGSVLRRLERIRTRRNGQVVLSSGRYFTLADLDEAIFAVAGVVYFTAAVDNIRRTTQLMVNASIAGHSGPATEREIHRALDSIPAIYQARQDGTLRISIISRYGAIVSPKPAKRTIMELSEFGGKPADISGQAWED